MTFRLLTYNIMHGGGDRVQAIAEVIKACAPDLVLLQEATDPAKVERIAELSGMADYRSVPPVARRSSAARRSRSASGCGRACRGTRSSTVVPAGERIRVFGVHLSAIIAAWTEQRRVFELRALLRKHRAIIASAFTCSPATSTRSRRVPPSKAAQLPLRLRPFLWLTGGRVQWRTIQTVLDAGYVDSFRMLHPDDPGLTLPTADPHFCVSITCSCRTRRPGASRSAKWCATPSPSAPPTISRCSPTCRSTAEHRPSG